jgi:hypothetical protein
MNFTQTPATITATRCTIAATPSSQDAVYRLRYHCYRRKLSIAYFGVQFKTQLLAVRFDELRRHVGNERPMVEAWSDALGWMGQSASLPTISQGRSQRAVA